MWKEALPVDYLDNKSKIGRCYSAEIDGPPTMVRPIEKGSHIVIELEDFMKIAWRDLGHEPPDYIMRLALPVSGARKLAYQLVHALAGSGDPIAEKVLTCMNEVIERERNGLS
jgi:hypothetical protein